MLSTMAIKGAFLKKHKSQYNDHQKGTSHKNVPGCPDFRNPKHFYWPSALGNYSPYRKLLLLGMVIDHKQKPSKIITELFLFESRAPSICYSSLTQMLR